MAASLNLSSTAYSPRQAYQGSPTATTVTSTTYVTPANTTNVPSPNATCVVKEIDVVNYSGAAVNVSVYAGGTANANLIAYFPFTANDTKMISGVNTMLPANTTIYVQTSVANSATITISVTEIQ